MKRVYLSVISIMVMSAMFIGFECSSTELTSAKLYIQQKNYPKAIEVLKKEVAKNPKSDEGYYLLGAIYAEQDNADSAIVAFNKSLEISNKFQKDIDNSKLALWATLTNRGATFFNRANTTSDKDSVQLYLVQAINALQGAVSFQPDSVVTYKYLVTSYFLSNRIDDAIPVLEKIMSLEPTEEVYRDLASIYLNKGVLAMSTDSLKAVTHFDKSVSTLKEGIAKHPKSTELFVALVQSYPLSSKKDEAFAFFNDGYQKNPTNGNYMYAYGMSLVDQQEYQKATELLEKGLVQNPDFSFGLFGLGVAYFNWGAKIRREMADGSTDGPLADEKFVKATENFKRYTELSPDSPQGWESLAKAYSVLGKTKEAEECFKKVDSLNKQ